VGLGDNAHGFPLYQSCFIRGDVEPVPAPGGNYGGNEGILDVSASPGGPRGGGLRAPTPPFGDGPGGGLMLGPRFFGAGTGNLPGFSEKKKGPQHLPPLDCSFTGFYDADSPRRLYSFQAGGGRGPWPQGVYIHPNPPVCLRKAFRGKPLSGVLCKPPSLQPGWERLSVVVGVGVRGV